MSFGAGHVMDMIQRMKQNRDMVKSRKRHFDRKKRLYDGPGNSVEYKLGRPLGLNDRTTDEDLVKARKMAHKQNRNTAILFLICFGITLAMFLYIFMIN